MATPRAQVSTAGFFDWSTEEFEEISMPSIYQTIAVTQKNKYNKNKKSWCTDGLHLNPGRMFVRDKAELTKGEREIIAGIYKNRGDLTSKNSCIEHVCDHKDAWLAGKHIPKKGALDDKCSFKIPDHLLGKADNQKNVTHATYYFCDNRIHENKFTKDYFGNYCKKIEKQDPTSSPDNLPKPDREQNSQKKSNPSEGGILIEPSNTFFDPCEGAKKKKVYVDVFLPTFVSSLHEEISSLSLKEQSEAITNTNGKCLLKN